MFELIFQISESLKVVAIPVLLVFAIVLNRKLGTVGTKVLTIGLIIIFASQILVFVLAFMPSINISSTTSAGLSKIYITEVSMFVVGTIMFLLGFAVVSLATKSKNQK